MSRDDHRDALIAGNRLEYGRHYAFLDFLTPERAAAAEAQRDELLAWLRLHAEFGCNDTKVDSRRLSPGCRTCAAGGWSCLFINGRCNASCFYCPTSQDDTGDPLTNGIPFATADDYAEYVSRFGFTGASISGGEPLLTPDRTLAYIDAVRRRCGDSVHIWMYTNGTLLTSDLARQLRAAGLGEIRFDIGATNYDLSRLKLAVGIIETVTVEIPTVPEVEGLLRMKMVEMAGAGVQHLNLHQLRLTPYNLRHLAGREHTFVHGESVTVLESELAALRLVRYGIEQGIDLPVNYCSFPYKRRFQHAAARRRGIPFVLAADEIVTDAGYLRTVHEGGTQYFEAVTLSGGSAAPASVEISLPSGRLVVVNKRAVSLPLTEEQLPGGLDRFERIAHGLAGYF